MPIDGGLFPTVIHENLSQLDGTEGKGVQREKDVITINPSSVADGWVNCTLQVVDRVEVKPCGVQESEFHGEAGDGL